MANANNTLTRTYSIPEKTAQWLFNSSSNCRHLLGFLLIIALTVISIRFNYELGKLSAVDETSEQLLPAGYALLDLCALFLSGFVALKSSSFMRKLFAYVWFFVLLSLSLWAAASFTISVDHRLESKDLMHSINQKKIELDGLNKDVETWRENVKTAVDFKTKHNNTLKETISAQKLVASELYELESSLILPTMAIYHKVSVFLPLNADTLSLIARLIWAGAMTLSPLVIVFLVVFECGTLSKPIDTSASKPVLLEA